MDIAKKVLNTLLVILVIASLLVIGVHLYYKYFITDFTIGINYMGDATGVDVLESTTLTDEEKEALERKTIFVANYYSNDANNGMQLRELQLNYFMDYKLQSSSYRSTGIQICGDREIVIDNWRATSFTSSECEAYCEEVIYYDTVNGISYNGTTSNDPDLFSSNTKMNRDTRFIIKIDNEAYAIQLNKTTQKSALFFSGTYIYNYIYLLDSVIQAIKTNSNGYGDWYITLDLSEYFTIYKYDTDGKFKEDDVSDIIKNYAVIKFHYDENGAQSSKQSLYNIIDCDSNWVYGGDIDVDYWQERVVYNYTIDQLSLRFSEVYGGNFVYLNSDIKAMFKDMPRAKLIITIDLDKAKELNKTIVGIDYGGFEGVKIDTINVFGEGNFILSTQSLNDTELQTLRYENTITLDKRQNYINSEYSEVKVWM